VYKSLDGGASWTKAGLGGKAIVALAVSAGDENLVFAASYANVWRTADGGGNWQDTGFSGADVYALALDDAGTLYAGTSNGIYRYQSGGWTSLALTGVPVTEVVLRPDKTGWLYAGTTSGLRISRNGGVTWASGPAELNGLPVNAITLDPGDPRRIYVSTTTQGVLRMQDY
jgi:ligand-binding sensor domain-containing protein